MVETLGNRVHYGQIYRSGRWHTPDGKQVLYDWFEDGGKALTQAALKFTEECHDACGGLVRGVLSPVQVDTCTEELLLKSQEWAKKLNVPLTIHVSQAVVEFNEMLRRHGKTPIAWLRDIGFLKSNVILGHAIIIGGSSWANYPGGDLDIMAESGCSVAHAPWVFGRRGIVMESFHKYQKAGINMTLGTDTCPQNMIQAMRWAAVISKIMERNPETATATDVFNAATLGGAKALEREDLGRLCAGAKADIVIFSGDSMNMVPMRDPVKNIVYNAETEDVKTVIINGRTVVEDGRVLGRDFKELNRRLQDAGEKLWPQIATYDWNHRSVDALSPPAFEFWGGEGEKSSIRQEGSKSEGDGPGAKAW
jgi:cytosine/adenosine deaminase-related metal-dependent hydrolase